MTFLSSSFSLKERRRLRLLRSGGGRGAGFVTLAFCTVCDFVFFDGAVRDPVVSTMGLPRYGGGSGARLVLGLEDRVGKLLARSDCSARHVLNMLELGDWHVDGGGERMVVAGMYEAVRECLRGAQSSEEGRSMLQSRARI